MYWAALSTSPLQQDAGLVVHIVGDGIVGILLVKRSISPAGQTTPCSAQSRGGWQRQRIGAHGADDWAADSRIPDRCCRRPSARSRDRCPAAHRRRSVLPGLPSGSIVGRHGAFRTARRWWRRPASSGRSHLLTACRVTQQLLGCSWVNPRLLRTAAIRSFNSMEVSLLFAGPIIPKGGRLASDSHWNLVNCLLTGTVSTFRIFWKQVRCQGAGRRAGIFLREVVLTPLSNPVKIQSVNGRRV